MTTTLEQKLTPEMIEALSTPAGKAALETLAARLTDHDANPLYKDARTYWTAVQGRQIAKGAAKYPETLNPSSWSLDALIDHAMEENVDQGHYLYAMKIKGDAMARDLELGRMAGNGLLAILAMKDTQPAETVLEYALGTAKGYERVWKALHGDK